MFGPEWMASARKYSVAIERDIKIPMLDGVNQSGDLWRPDGAGRFPGVPGFHCYHAGGQTGPIKPAALDMVRNYRRRYRPRV